MNPKIQQSEVDFSVVIPALNLRASLELVLRCLEAQIYPADRFECIIVDDGSTDGTQEMLEAYRERTSFRVSFISNTVPQGRGAARNQGWRQSRGNVVVFLDGDNLPSPQFLWDHQRAFASGAYDVVAGGRYCIEVNPKQENLAQCLSAMAQATSEDLFRENPARQFDCLHRQAVLSVYRAPAFQKFELQMRQLCRQSPRSSVCAYSFVGTNIAVTRSFLEETNGYDQFLRRGEDTDLGIRLWEAGARFGFADGANAYHQTAAGEINRGLDSVESIAFFYRHPYRMVLLIYLWFVHQFKEPAAESIHPAFENLLVLADEVGRDSGVDIGQEFQRLRLPPMPTNCHLTKEELISYYAETIGCPGSLISECIDSAVADGLYTKRQDGRLLFDQTLTSNWLRYRAPLHEYQLKNTSYYWRYRHTLLQRDAPRVVSCEGRYDLAIDRRVLEDSRVAAVLNIPLPVENEAQTSLRFADCFPSDLLAHADAKRHTIPRYAWPDHAGEVRLSYRFTCEIIEKLSGRDLKRDSSEDGAEPVAPYLRPALTPAEYPKAKIMLKKIMAGSSREASVLAEKIYYWLLDNISHFEPPPTEANILDTGFGLSHDYAKLFVNLCRLAAIPARLRCGALFENSAFTHAWAEFYIRGQGWKPVDFSSWLYGSRSMTRRNVQDLRLRNSILTETGLHDTYYFGNLDPYRVHAGVEALESQVAVELSDGKRISIRQSLQINAVSTKKMETAVAAS